MPGPIKFFIDQDAEDPAQALVASFTQQGAAQVFAFTQSDKARAVEVHLLLENPISGSPPGPFIYDDPTPVTAEISIGAYSQPVTSGTFTITDSGVPQTTAAIPFNSTGATVQAPIRAGLTTNFGSAIVTGNAGGPWLLDRGVTVAYATDPAGSTAGISPPESVLQVIHEQAGTALIDDIWQLDLMCPPAILASLSGTYLPAAAVAVASVVGGSAGVNASQSLTWNANAYAGGVSLALTAPGQTTIASGSSANPTVFTTPAPHGLNTGDQIAIAGSNQVSNNATWTAAVLTTTTFSVPNNPGASTGATYTVTRTVGPLSFDAAPADIVNALGSFGTTNTSNTPTPAFAVIQNGPGSYNITFQGPLAGLAIPDLVPTQALSVPVGLSGTLNCNTAGVIALLGANSEVSTTLQVKIFVAGVPTVRVVVPATLRQSLSPVGAVSSSPAIGMMGQPVRFLVNVTALTGGGSTDLDGQPTALSPNPLLVYVCAGSGAQAYELALAPPVNVASMSAANPSVVTTSSPHGFQTGFNVLLAGVVGGTVSGAGTINASHVVTVTSATTFSIPLNITVAPTASTGTASVQTTSPAVIVPTDYATSHVAFFEQ